MSNEAFFSRALGNLATISSGYPLRGSVETLEEGDVRLVQLKHMSTEADIDWDAVPLVSLPPVRKHAWLTDADVIFASRGTRTLAYPLVNTPPRTVCAPQFFVLSVSNTETLVPQFLAWQINQRPAQDYFQKNATGSYIQNIRREVVEKLTISVPPIKEQHLIIEFWRAAQRERAALNHLIQNRNTQLEALALRLLQHPTGANA